MIKRPKRLKLLLLNIIKHLRKKFVMKLTQLLQNCEKKQTKKSKKNIK